MHAGEKVMEDMYKCIKSFTLQMCDDDVHKVENHMVAVIKGSRWKRTNGSVTGSTVHLSEVGRDWNWIDITEERFNGYFEKVR